MPHTEVVVPEVQGGEIAAVRVEDLQGLVGVLIAAVGHRQLLQLLAGLDQAAVLLRRPFRETLHPKPHDTRYTRRHKNWL